MRRHQTDRDNNCKNTRYCSQNSLYQGLKVKTMCLVLGEVVIGLQLEETLGCPSHFGTPNHSC